MKTIFFKPKYPRLAKAVDISSPSQFKASIERVKKLRGFSSLQKTRALALAKARASVQLKRKNLSAKERLEFQKISKTRIPKM
jgi:hypothetical protein